MYFTHKMRRIVQLNFLDRLFGEQKQPAKRKNVVDRADFPYSARERHEFAQLLKVWVKNVRLEPYASKVAKHLLKICKIAASKYFKSCDFADRYDLEMDMFRLMWQGLPEAYDPERTPDEINFMWFMNRCRMYMTGYRSRGYGLLGCQYTAAKLKIDEYKKDWVAELCGEDAIERPDAHPHKVDTNPHYHRED